MSISEPDEMALERSKAVVLPKFDMHVITSDLTLDELKTAVDEYAILEDLHPRLPPPGIMMNRLPSRYIGLYIEQFETGGLRVPFSSFFLAVIKHFEVHVSQLVPFGVNRVILFEIRCISLGIWPTVSLFWVFYKLCKQGHWFSFKNKTEGRAQKCFKEVTTSLKGWKKKFFVIDRRAIPDAMPWRHGDTNLHDDFLANYDETDVTRISEFLVPLRPPPRHLLYVCGLTTACRHPELCYDIKDKGKNVIDMDNFLKLPSWTGIIVTQKNLEKPDAKVAAAREKKKRRNLAKAKAKRAGADAGGVGGSRKKRKIQKKDDSVQSWSERTLSVTPRQAIPEIVKTAAVATPEVAKVVSDVKKAVVDLSDNTRMSTPSVEVNQPSPPRQHDNTQVSPHLDAHSQSSAHGHGDESLVDKYLPN
ncbi:hypothetical protein Tco_0687481 [Tanacetum coccineum]